MASILNNRGGRNKDGSPKKNNFRKKALWVIAELEPVIRKLEIDYMKSKQGGLVETKTLG